VPCGSCTEFDLFDLVTILGKCALAISLGRKDRAPVIAEPMGHTLAPIRLI